MFKPLLLAALLLAPASDVDDDSLLPVTSVIVDGSAELLIDFSPGVQALTSGDHFAIVLDGQLGPLMPLRDLARMPGGAEASTVGTSGCALISLPGAFGQTHLMLVPFTITGHGSNLPAAVADYKAEYAAAVGNGYMPVPCPPSGGTSG